MSIQRLFDCTPFDGDPSDLYKDLGPVVAPPGRPYTWINMVATLDGKTLLAPRGSTAKGLGSATDQVLMRRLQSHAQAILVGAGTLRAGNLVYDPSTLRIALTVTGDLPATNRFFTDAPGRSVVFTLEEKAEVCRNRLGNLAEVIGVQGRELSARLVAEYLRRERGVERLLIEGGATTNARFFEAGLVDELYLTLAPKLKAGGDLPGIADGPGLTETAFLACDLVSVYRDAGELYLRYRVAAGAARA